jgi:hypothetical protein
MRASPFGEEAGRCTALANVDAAVLGGPKSGICGPIRNGLVGLDEAFSLDDAFCLDRWAGTAPGTGPGGSGGRV